MERHVQFWDLANLESAFRRLEARINFIAMRRYLAAGRHLIDAFCYVPQNPVEPDSRASLIRHLRKHGFFVRTKVGRKRRSGGWKCDFDVQITCDILRIVECSKPDTIVVCSGDRDMLPVYRAVREQGVRVEVAATKWNVASDILEAASSFIDLGKLVAEQRAASQQVHGNGAAVNAP